jgi:hypothetical protein
MKNSLYPLAESAHPAKLSFDVAIERLHVPNVAREHERVPEPKESATVISVAFGCFEKWRVFCPPFYPFLFGRRPAEIPLAWRGRLRKRRSWGRK